MIYNDYGVSEKWKMKMARENGQMKEESRRHKALNGSQLAKIKKEYF